MANWKDAVDTIVARCSEFSGWKLVWEIEQSDYGLLLYVHDPKDDNGRSWLRVWVSRSIGCLNEGTGRLRNWGISWEERSVITDALNWAEENAEFCDTCSVWPCKCDRPAVMRPKKVLVAAFPDLYEVDCYAAFPDRKCECVACCPE